MATPYSKKQKQDPRMPQLHRASRYMSYLQMVMGPAKRGVVSFVDPSSYNTHQLSNTHKFLALQC